MRPSPAVFLLALALAGCSQPEVPPVEPQQPGLMTELVPWDEDEYIYRSGGCLNPPGVCFGGRGAAWPEFRLAANERLEAFAITITAVGESALDSPDPVNVKASCRESNDPCQANATFEARMPLPASIAGHGLGWPFGASLVLEYARDQDLAKYGDNFPAHRVHIQGEMTVVRDPTIALPELEPRVTGFEYETTTGVCAFTVEPDCSSGPWRTLYLPPIEGSPRRLWANATWDPVSPSAQELRFTLYCSSGGRTCGGFPFEFQGPSPLAIDTGDLSALDVPDDADLRMGVDEASVEPVRDFTALTRQPFVLRGSVLSEVEVWIEEP